MDTMLTYNTNSKTGPVCGAGQLKKKDIEKKSDHRDIIYYIFKACEYEQYARTSE